MLRDSGINLIYGLYETANDQLDDVQKSLDLCQKYGIKYLVRDSNTNEPDEELMRAALEKYAKHPAFAGLKVQDEPGVNSFERFGDAHPIFQKLLPDKYFYINLLPSYSTPAQLQYGAATTQTSGSITFEQYLDAYIKTVKPKFLSYDYYALTEKKDFIQTGYFNELSTFRKLGLKNNIPYWVFIQACSFNSLTRRPNEAEILWQVNTSLAYGAKGIQYFCYFTPIEDDIFQGNFIDKNGNKTEIYAYGQKANRQIAAVDDVLMNSVSKGVIVTGTSPILDSRRRYTDKIRCADRRQPFGRRFPDRLLRLRRQKCVLCCQQLHHAKRHRHAAVREIGQRQPGNRRGQNHFFRQLAEPDAEGRRGRSGHAFIS